MFSELAYLPIQKRAKVTDYKLGTIIPKKKMCMKIDHYISYMCLTSTNCHQNLLFT
jgi:hypothetical protein